MHALVAIALFTLQPALQEPLEDQVDLIEVNHFYDDEGRLVFDQAIFYDWCGVATRYQVRAWRLVKHPSQLPQRDWQRGGYVTVWRDGDLLRRVHAASYRETWTQHDPELDARQLLPAHERRGLSIPYLKDCEPVP